MTKGENYYHGGLLHFDLSPKPAYLTLKRLFNEVWRTNKTLCAKNGEVALTGFYGEYEMDIEINGAVHKKKIRLTKENETSALPIIRI